MRYYFTVLFAVLLLAIPWFATIHPNDLVRYVSSISEKTDQVASAVLTHNPKSISDLQDKYVRSLKKSEEKVRVLIVPGHEPGYGGAEFGLLRERELSLELSNYLVGFMKNNQHYDVIVSRDAKSWNPVFAKYFRDGWDEISAWDKAAHQEISRLIAIGDHKKVSSKVIHNTAPTNVALRLYGMTKWANENDVDIIIHVHLNDYPNHPRAQAGKYSGFAIYVPESQYDNSTTTKALAESVFKRIVKYNPVSNFPGESSGIIEEPDLIAVGANNTSDAPSMLIEYGYIYEPQFVNPLLRKAALRDLAFQTYLGLQDFFDPKAVVGDSAAFDTLLVPTKWNAEISKTSTSSPEIYALQTALVIDGLYPPKDKKLIDCPRTGSLGPCTLQALDDFQRRYGITDEKGTLGPKTRSVLNSRFGTGNII